MEIKWGADQDLNTGLDTSKLFIPTLDAGTELGDIVKLLTWGLTHHMHSRNIHLCPFLSLLSYRDWSKLSHFSLSLTGKQNSLDMDVFQIYHSLIQLFVILGTSIPLPQSLWDHASWHYLFFLSSCSFLKAPSALVLFPTEHFEHPHPCLYISALCIHSSINCFFLSNG